MAKKPINGSKVKTLDDTLDVRKIKALERDITRVSLELHHTTDTMSYVKAIHRYNALNSKYAHLVGRPYSAENQLYPQHTTD